MKNFTDEIASCHCLGTQSSTYAPPMAIRSPKKVMRDALGCITDTLPLSCRLFTLAT